MIGRYKPFNPRAMSDSSLERLLFTEYGKMVLTYCEREAATSELWRREDMRRKPQPKSYASMTLEELEQARASNTMVDMVKYLRLSDEIVCRTFNPAFVSDGDLRRYLKNHPEFVIARDRVKTEMWLREDIRRKRIECDHAFTPHTGREFCWRCRLWRDAQVSEQSPRYFTAFDPALFGGNFTTSITGHYIEDVYVVDNFHTSQTAAQARSAALEQARLAYECHQFYAQDFVESGLLYRGLCYTCHSFKKDPIHLKDGESADARIKALKAVR